MSDNRQEVCHACGGPLIDKQVEKLLRGGVHTAVVQVVAEVCQRCGEQLFSPETVRQFEEIRGKLAKQETGDYLPIGQSFQVSSTEQPAS
jgi:YgiT-type zinc finger domain-containing protein